MPRRAKRSLLELERVSDEGRLRRVSLAQTEWMSYAPIPIAQCQESA